ncbi:MAG: hypothetical protein FJ294_12235 [Planctomycetes bacterium]|nr:hypothetical protein [Planctomycetota bacterium]
MSHRIHITSAGRSLAVGALALLGATSCGSKWQTYNEQLISTRVTPATDAPEWVKGQIQTDPAMLSFVGRGGGFNVLDERKAFDEAFMHAREQLAQYVGTRVTSESCDQDWSDGARYLPLEDSGPGPGEKPGQAIRSRAKQVAEAIVGELLPVAQYWEQWDVSETPERKWDGHWFENKERMEIRRCKCWVLAQIPRSNVDKFVNATLEMLKNEIEVARLQAEVESLKLAAAAKPAAPVDAQAQINAQWQSLISSKEHEIHTLRERIHYGRLFRLTTEERGLRNCPETPTPCPDWRHASVALTATVASEAPVAIAPAAAPAKANDCDCPLVGGR